MARIARALRIAVFERSEGRCEYCRSATLVTSGPLQVDHIVPESKGGLTSLDNLALACSRCNSHKATRTRFRDPVSRRIVPLYHPRRQRWLRHFSWRAGGSLIVGLTRTGRATVVALNMNDTMVVMSRSHWISLGIHPPVD